MDEKEVFPFLRGAGDDSDASSGGRAIGEEVYDTDGNVATDRTLVGDIDGRETTLGALRDYVAQDAAYYITRDAAGNAFETYAQLAATTTYYSGGEVRIPTRNDYCVVLADETHGGSEWRYVYAVAEGETSGEWQAQYPIETNDYEALSNKPQINGVELSGNQTAAELGVATPGDLADAIAPDFSTIATYAVGQLVNYEGTVYICTTAVTNPGDWTGSANWSTSNATVQDAINAIDVSSQITGKINSTSIAPDFDADEPYVDGTYVTHLGVLYKLTADHAVGTTWENTSKEPAVVMEPDATLGIVNGHLQVKNSQGVVIWQETPAPVTKVNNKTGDVTLQASDVDALSLTNGGTVNANVTVVGSVTSNSAVIKGANNETATITKAGVTVSGTQETVSLFPAEGIAAADEPNVLARKQDITWANLPDKPTIPAAQVQADWDESDSDAASYIQNKPLIPGPQVQADWDESDSDADSFILNKPDFEAKLDSTAAAPEFDATKPYVVGDYVTYYGGLYVCKEAHPAGAWNPTHFDLTDMTTPDATLDVTSQGALRVVSADGTILWQQGYNLKTTSLTDDDSDATNGITIDLSNEAVNYYAFAKDYTGEVTIALPARTTGKVSDFILDVSNAATATAFSATTDYAVNDRVLYGGAIYYCSTAHSAGAWSSSDFTLVYSAFSSAATSYAVGALVVYNNKLWKCTVALDKSGDPAWDGSWTGEANWETAHFTLDMTNNSFIVADGDNLDDMTSITVGELSEFYFTLTAFQLGSNPTYKVVKQVVVDATEVSA